MHFVQAKGILSPKNGMNLYRGCTHGCIYCDSRSHCYQINHQFEDIEVKENALELLEQALRRKRKPCMLSTGSMTDPYIPLERELGYVRGALELADRYGFGFTLITKSADVLRDLELFRRINAKTKCVIQMTLTTYDEGLCKKLEPAVSTTRQRFEALCALRDAGIPTVVWICPMLPFINDTEENLQGLLDYCTQARVAGIINFGMGMTLREGNREYFYQQLDRLFPGMKEKYIKGFRDSYHLSSPNGKALMALLKGHCREHGIMYKTKEVFEYLGRFEDKQEEQQLSLF